MPVLTWKDLVRVHITEPSRKQTLELTDAIVNLDASDDTDPIALSSTINLLFTLASTRAISVFDGKKWVEVTAPTTFTYDETTWQIAPVIDAETFDALPVSLTREWGEMAMKHNQALYASFFPEPAPEPPTSAANTKPDLEPTSDNVPSSAA